MPKGIGDLGAQCQNTYQYSKQQNSSVNTVPALALLLEGGLRVQEEGDLRLYDGVLPMMQRSKTPKLPPHILHSKQLMGW